MSLQAAHGKAKGSIMIYVCETKKTQLSHWLKVSTEFPDFEQIITTLIVTWIQTVDSKFSDAGKHGGGGMGHTCKLISKNLINWNGAVKARDFLNWPRTWRLHKQPQYQNLEATKN